MTIFAGYMKTKKNWFSSRENGSRHLSDPKIQNIKNWIINADCQTCRIY